MRRRSFLSSRSRAPRVFAALAVSTLGVFATLATFGARDASAFCRTTTGPAPDAIGECFPSVDPNGNPYYPLFWKNLCVGYSLTNHASDYVSQVAATSIAEKAFAHWTGTTCTSDGTSGSRVSIDARNLGPVDCDTNIYVTGQPNQHVIFFSDYSWPYGDGGNTLGKTFVTYDSDTGEIYDADMAINTFLTNTPPSTIWTSDSTDVPSGDYDLESIMTHEAGHFLGLAHSDNQQAVMYPSYNAGTTNLRDLTDDDIQGICSVYHPDGNRTVLKVDGSEVTPGDACDPTPRGGFGSACPTPQSSGCSASPSSARSSSTDGLALASSIGLVFVLRSRRRSRSPSRCSRRG